MDTLRLYCDVMKTFHNQFFCFKVTSFDAAMVLLLKFKSDRHVKIRAAYWGSASTTGGARLDRAFKQSGYEDQAREIYGVSVLDSDEFIESMVARQKLKKELGGKLSWVE